MQWKIRMAMLLPKRLNNLVVSLKRKYLKVRVLAQMLIKDYRISKILKYMVNI